MSPLALVLTILLSAAPSSQAVQEKERGDRLAANGDLAGAADAYDNAEKLTPGYAEAINQHGFLFARQGKLEDSIPYFKRAIESDSSFPLAHYNLGFVLRKLGRHAEATEALKAYVALAPDDASGQYSLADSYNVVGDKTNALKAYERYVAIEKDAGKQSRVDKANQTIAQLRREVGIAASSAPSAGTAAAPAAAGTTTVEVEVTPAAGAPAAAAPATAVTAVAATAPAAAHAPAAPATTAAPQTSAPAARPQPSTPVSPERVALAQKKMEEARAMRAAGKKRETLFALQDAVNADPNNARAVFELGVAYAESFYYPQAIERWQRVLTMDVDEATRASARENIEKANKLMSGAAGSSAPAAAPAASAPAAAATTASAPAAAAPASANGAAAPGQVISVAAQDAYLKGAELYRQQRYADAIKQFEAAIAAKADFPQAYTARGSAYFATQELGKALADYSQAMRLDPTLASPVFGVAETLSAMGRKADAIPYYQAYAASHASDVDAGLQDVARKRLAEIGK